MGEYEAGSVQERALEPRDRAQVARDAAPDTAVQRISDHRVADRAEMHANLVRAPRVNRHARQRQSPSEVFGADNARHGGPRTPCPSRHLLTIGGIASDRLI